jgi:hypothetical protein
VLLQQGDNSLSSLHLNKKQLAEHPLLEHALSVHFSVYLYRVV